MIQNAERRQQLTFAIALLLLAGATAPVRAEADLTLTTRFVQGSFDVLLPDGWVAALAAGGRAMEAQSPKRHKLWINARVRNADQAAEAREFHLGRLRDNELLNVQIVSEHELLGGRLNITIARPRFSEESGMGHYPGPERLTHQVLASYRANEPEDLWLDAGLIVFGEDPPDESWVDFLVATLESVRVSEHQSWGGPLYRRLKTAPQVDVVEAVDILGSWQTLDIVGKATFSATSSTGVVLADGGLEELTFFADGRYISMWSGRFLTLEGGDMIARHSDHRESGRWALRGKVLLLAPESAQRRSFEDSDNKGEFVPAQTRQRRYEVILREGFPVLRGACPAFAEMEYCKDFYTGGRRVLDFILEPID